MGPRFKKGDKLADGMFDGGELEHKVVEKSVFGGEVTSTQQRTPIIDESGWMVDEVLSLHVVPFEDCFHWNWQTILIGAIFQLMVKLYTERFIQILIDAIFQLMASNFSNSSPLLDFPPSNPSLKPANKAQFDPSRWLDWSLIRLYSRF